MSATRIGIVTKEWPPAVYGGAGVHVVQLTQALRKVSGIEVDVHAESETPLAEFETHGTTSPIVLVTAVTPTPASRITNIKKPNTKCRNDPAPRTISRFGTDAK